MLSLTVHGRDYLLLARNEPMIITRNFKTLLRNVPMKNPATPLPANETRGVGIFSIILQLLFPYHAVLWSSTPCAGIITTTNSASNATPKGADSLFIFIQSYDIKLLRNIFSVQSDKCGWSC